MEPDDPDVDKDAVQQAEEVIAEATRGQRFLVIEIDDIEHTLEIKDGGGVSAWEQVGIAHWLATTAEDLLNDDDDESD